MEAALISVEYTLVNQITRTSLLLGTLSDVSRLTLGRLELRLVNADLGAIMR